MSKVDKRGGNYPSIFDQEATTISIPLLSFRDGLFKIKSDHRLRLEISCTESIMEVWNPLICEVLIVHIFSQNKEFPEVEAPVDSIFRRLCRDSYTGHYLSYPLL